MAENYEHYISKHLKDIYKKRLITPIIYLLLIFILLQFVPILAVASPYSVNPEDTLDRLYQESEVYVHTQLNDLQFTGYTRNQFGQTIGYYYYYLNSDNAFSLVLLSPATSEQGLPSIDQVTVFAKIMPRSTVLTDLYKNLAADLGWTLAGVTSRSSLYYLSEPDYHFFAGLILFLFAAITSLVALLSIVCSMVYILFPHLSPPVRRLSPFGKPKQLLAQAEEELVTLPQLATEDMFITENFFIETSKYGTALIPIKDILWIYKHSTLHKIFWYHMSISYSLNISATKKIFISCPKNIKSDIDGIIDYLAEANHNILVGFNEENRLKVREIQGHPFHLERLFGFLKNRS
ncbi:MAG: DUF6709 family protein [Lachnospiraceae bacterium]